LHRRPEVVNRAQWPEARAYQHARRYAKTGSRNSRGIKCEIKEHIMDTR